METAMRQVLAELELLSHGTVTNYAGIGGGSHDYGRPPGEEWPPHLRWRTEWDRAKDDQARLAALNGAREELSLIRDRKVLSFSVESEAALEARIVREGEGWSVEEVAQHARCTVTFVRKARLKAGVSITTGIPAGNKAEAKDEAQRARELAENGMSERQIRMVLKVGGSKLSRLLGKAA